MTEKELERLKFLIYLSGELRKSDECALWTDIWDKIQERIEEKKKKGLTS